MLEYKKQIEWIVLVMSLLIFLPASAAMVDSDNLTADKSSLRAEKKKTIPIETDFTLTAGYRVDDLDWNIAVDISGKNQQSTRLCEAACKTNSSTFSNVSARRSSS